MDNARFKSNIKKQKIMAKKNVKKKDDNDALLEQAQEAYVDYRKLSRMLFANPETSIYDVNELQEGDQFYDLARGIADELEIDWETMKHAQSNRIMLAMLERKYQDMKKTEGGLVINVSFSFPEKKKEGDGGSED